MSMSGIPVASEIESHRQTGVHVPDQPADVHDSTKHDSTVARFAVVPFSGNGTQNRAIAHGFGKKPTWFRVVPYNPDGLIGTQWVQGMGAIQHFFTGSLSAVTECDATNIYVGNAVNFHGNVSGGSYAIIIGG